MSNSDARQVDIFKQYVAILVLLLTGCASSPIDLSDTKALMQREAVVFGRVKVISKGEPFVRSWYSWSPPVSVSILPEATGELIDYMLIGDGTFYWHLPPDSYTIADFRWGYGTNYDAAGRIFAQFTIHEGQATIYIGTLTITLDKARYSMRIEDDYDQAIQGLKSKFPEMQGAAVKSLMQLEKPR